MKNILLIAILILTAGSLNAQSSFLKRTIADKKEQLSERRQLKNFCKAEKKDHSFFRFSMGAIQPRISVNILDGSGIHLFTIPESVLFPAVQVGARFKAGIVITI